MMYLLLWYGLIVFTVAASLIGFFWGLKNGQFTDQQRVGFLPLMDMPAEPDGGPRSRPARPPFELYVMALCVILVMAALAASLLLSIGNPGGGPT